MFLVVKLLGWYLNEGIISILIRIFTGALVYIIMMCFLKARIQLEIIDVLNIFFQDKKKRSKNE